MAYEVCTPVYEGPFDLLLHLILKEEVELWEVSLAQVIDAFLVEIDRLDRLDLNVTTEFLLIAVDARRAQGPPPAARARR